MNMKPIPFLVTVIITLLSAGSSVFAQSDGAPLINSTGNAQSETAPASPFLFFGLSGAFGWTSPTGSFDGSKSTPKTDIGYGGGFNAGYGHNKYLQGMFGIEYLHENFSVSRTYNGNPAQYTLQTDFINISLGYRGRLKYLYWDLGLFYGLKMFNWTEKITMNGATTTNSLSGSRADECKNIFGSYIGVGGSYPLNAHVILDCGIKAELAFTPAYKGRDTIKTQVILITAGITYITPLLNR